MHFHSTRGLAPEADLQRIALQGLAPDGGLYLPKTWPQFSAADIAEMREAPYQDIALKVLSPFLSGALREDALREIIRKSYATFESAEVTPVRDLGKHKILELFHGPTLAFKDVALQFVGHMFEHLLRDSDRRITVIGATSGDTGSAALAALANRNNLDVFILYPDKGPSEIQRKQMTCVDAPNVHAIAVDGSFDDCQCIVKALFADERRRNEWNLTTINSINFLRILAQIVYYFAAASKVEGTPSFVVPTGNFGDIFAGYAAKKCGLPVEKLVVASNSNNILTRFFRTGRMTPDKVRTTFSPSMDIQISSNFERLLFDLCQGNSSEVRLMMADLKDKGSFSVLPDQLAHAHSIFDAAYATDDETLETMSSVYRACGYVLDPHTAVGFKAAEELAVRLAQPLVLLATASPAKFPETVQRALGFAPSLPERVASLISKPERTTKLSADLDQIEKFIEKRRNHDRSNYRT
jgi:threonine synthase